MQMSYWRFAAMIATSTVVMYGLMYLNTWKPEHVYWSETRAWMALLMGATMAVIMLGFMLKMYGNRKVNIAIFSGAALLFALSLWLVRSQATISGVDYMKAMIPHHSIAIMTSERAQIVDPRVRKLADEIIEAQRREIAEMRYLVELLDDGQAGAAARHGAEAPPRIVPAPVAIEQANIATTDLSELDDAEVDKVLGRGPRCSFSYSIGAPPVLAAAWPDVGGNATAVVKLHGRLVELSAAYAMLPPSAAVGLRAVADGIEVAVMPGDEAASDAASPVHEADAVLRLDAGLEVGYGGFHRCDEPLAAAVAAG